MSSISPTTVTERLRNGDEDLYLLDIRGPDVFEEWHIPDSENIHISKELKSSPAAAKSVLEELPADKEIVTICGKGKLSQTATDVLRDMGYDAKTMEDGLRGWSRVHRDDTLGLDIPGNLFQIARPGTGCLSYLLISDGEALVIDPSLYPEPYEDLLDQTDADLVAVLETHAHADHISGARIIARTNEVQHYLHAADQGDLKTASAVRDGDEIRVGSATVHIVHTPGHTPGSVTVSIDDEALLTGDTLFLENVGRPDLGSASAEELRDRAQTLYESLQRLREFPEDTIVAPGHDPGSPEPPVAAPLAQVTEMNDRLTTDADSFVEALTTNPPATPPNHDRIKRINTGRESAPEEGTRDLELGPNRCAAE